MNFSLKIPVTDYQYKLLTHMLGKSPYKCNFKNNLGKMISSVFMYGDDNPKVSIHKPGDKVFEIEIPNSWLVRYGVRYISEKSISDFIEMQDRLFKKQLYQYINGVIDFKQTYNKSNKTILVAKMKDVALCYLEKNGFTEDDVNFETIKKGYQRYKIQNTSSAFTNVSVIFCSLCPLFL
jgi:hypothetical protein